MLCKFRGAAHGICNLRYKVPKNIPIVLHNGSTYNYHCIIKHIPEKFKGWFECLGENTEKYIIFQYQLKKKLVMVKKKKLIIVKKENNHVQNKVYW